MMKVLITGGGTGGHVYPAVALIRYWREVDPSVEFVYVGSKRGIEKKIIEKEDIKFIEQEVYGLVRKVTPKNIKVIYKLFKSYRHSKKILKTYRPDVVLGMGGYVSAPTIMASTKMKVKTVLHEQNSYPGLVNRRFAKKVDKVAICFKHVKQYLPKEKVVLTGNPRASEVLTDNRVDLRKYALDNSVKTVLIYGGSGGARLINNTVIELANGYSELNYQVLLVTGERYFDEINDQINHKRVVVTPYISNMPELLNTVDLVVCRSGATTIAELESIGVPSVLIPSPNVTANHQYYNAMSLVDTGGAVMIEESTLSAEALYQKINEILENPIKYENMKVALSKNSVKDAAQKLMQILID